MIRRNADKHVDVFEKKFGADGFITVTSITNSVEELEGGGRCFAHTKVEPGSGIGFHKHDKESEIYYVLKGTAEYNDNGKIVRIGPGDVAITKSGEGHGLRNDRNETLEIIALIVYQKKTRPNNNSGCFPFNHL